jgi:UrcA family protein
MVSMKSVAAALVFAASVADLAAPALVAPALALGAASAVRAEPVVRQQVVRYQDLNLANASGKAALQARVRDAAQAVCSPEPDPRNFDETADYKACVARAVRDAITALPETRQHASQPARHAG